jgi:hypothetical protein
MRNVQVMLPPLGRAAVVLDLLHVEMPEVLAHVITNTTGTWLLVGEKPSRTHSSHFLGKGRAAHVRRIDAPFT